MGLMFYPRGGSAQVAAYLSRALGGIRWEVVLASGSLGSPGEQAHAAPSSMDSTSEGSGLHARS